MLPTVKPRFETKVLGVLSRTMTQSKHPGVQKRKDVVNWPEMRPGPNTFENLLRKLKSAFAKRNPGNLKELEGRPMEEWQKLLAATRNAKRLSLLHEGSAAKY